ncbi:carbon storage regulator [Scatolibacter rhodanostii]|uniref:carbon storage regulator n=1 Tax=Scatolibacter rhodanostii TaxID=2014781 RepID=UPI000C0869D8|nr:carbon storage regulator [Scatolibacter rhodanostii]
MLIITRKEGDSVVIDLGEEIIEITVTEVGKQVRLGITAPEKCKIWRKELYLTIEENKQAIADTQPQNLRKLLHHLSPPSE